jgi:hypothetical protein
MLILLRWRENSSYHVAAVEWRLIMANDHNLAKECCNSKGKGCPDVNAELIITGCAACKDNLTKGAKAIPRKSAGISSY